MPVRDTSKIALEKTQSKLPRITQQVFEMILELGPTHNNRILECLNQKEQSTLKPRYQKRKWQINQVCGRVNELVHIYCIVEDLGPHKGTWYRKKKTYHLWRVIGDEREPIGWRPIQEKISERPKSRREHKAHLRQIRERAEQPVLARLAKAIEFQPTGRRRATMPTSQGLLFA